MKKSFFGLILLFVLLTTYSPKFSFIKDLNLNIENIEIENNTIIKTEKIKDRLIFLYN